MKVLARCPGKVTVLGEHAVVYGKPALVAAISRYVRVTAETRADNTLSIYAQDTSLRIVQTQLSKDFDRRSVTDRRARTSFRYVLEAIRQTSEAAGRHVGADITIKSDMPSNAGLGTSAAVTVATVAAYAELVGVTLSKAEISRMGQNVESTIQGSSSGMDTAAVTYGGILYVKRSQRGLDTRKIEPKAQLPLGVAYVRRRGNTAAALRMVAKLYSRHSQAVSTIMDCIAQLVAEGTDCMSDGDLVSLGEAMNINHGMLAALGLSNNSMEQIVYHARKQGVLGAKITGAGLGGSVVMLGAGTPEINQVVESFTLRGQNAVRVQPDTQGLAVQHL